VVFDKKGNSICIDPGGKFEKIGEILEKNKLHLKAVLITHPHFDHVLGVPEIKKDVSLYVPEEDINLYNSAREFTKNLLGFDPGEFRKPDYLLKGDEELEIGNIKIKVHYVPGHTQGHLMYEIDKNLFCGDLIFAGSIGRTDFPESSWQKMKDSLLYVIRNFSDDYEIYPGHGPKTNLGNEKRENPFLIELL